MDAENRTMQLASKKKKPDIRDHKILLLALGNDILGDDAVGLYAARDLAKQFSGQIEIVEAPIGGFALIDLLHGYDKVLIIDSITSVSPKPGLVREIDIDGFQEHSFPSPHYVGLKEIIELAQTLEIPFPAEIRILGIEVVDPYILRNGLSPEIEAHLPALVREAERILGVWVCKPAEQAIG